MCDFKNSRKRVWTLTPADINRILVNPRTPRELDNPPNMVQMGPLNEIIGDVGLHKVGATKF